MLWEETAVIGTNNFYVFFCQFKKKIYFLFILLSFTIENISIILYTSTITLIPKDIWLILQMNEEYINIFALSETNIVVKSWQWKRDSADKHFYDLQSEMRKIFGKWRYWKILSPTKYCYLTLTIQFNISDFFAHS